MCVLPFRSLNLSRRADDNCEGVRAGDRRSPEGVGLAVATPAIDATEHPLNLVGCDPHHTPPGKRSDRVVATLSRIQPSRTPHGCWPGVLAPFLQRHDVSGGGGGASTTVVVDSTHVQHVLEFQSIPMLSRLRILSILTLTESTHVFAQTDTCVDNRESSCDKGMARNATVLYAPSPRRHKHWGRALRTGTLVKCS